MNCRQASFGKKHVLLVSLHAAKHRFESLATPLGSWVAWVQAIVRPAREVVIMRAGPEQVDAQLFLGHITTERCVLLSMLADASDDGLVFARQHDDFDNMDPASISAEVRSFLLNAVEQYVHGKIVTSYGYTRYMLDVLKLAPNGSPQHCPGGEARVFQEHRPP